MRTTISAIGLLLGLAVSAGAQQGPKGDKPIPWSLYNKGVHWEESLEAAMSRAQKENKPVLLYQLVGDLKLEGT